MVNIFKRVPKYKSGDNVIVLTENCRGVYGKKAIIIEPRISIFGVKYIYRYYLEQVLRITEEDRIVGYANKENMRLYNVD